MVQLTKIYTKVGDAGETMLVGGERIAKTDIRLQACGDIDELNSCIGLVRTLAATSAHDALEAEADATLRRIQNDLFDIGSLLATAPGSRWAGMAVIDAERVDFLEARIDAYQEILEHLPSFVLPGGGLVNGHAHVARTVCRRAERVLWQLHEIAPVAAHVLSYINRLSDFLFVFSRWVARQLGESEYLWDTPLGRGEAKPEAGVNPPG